VTRGAPSRRAFGAALLGSVRRDGTIAGSRASAGRRYERGRLVGDPDELVRLHVQPLSKSLDDARATKTIEDV